jgi:hypothetical protein
MGKNAEDQMQLAIDTASCAIRTLNHTAAVASKLASLFTLNYTMDEVWSKF